MLKKVIIIVGLIIIVTVLVLYNKSGSFSVSSTDETTVTSSVFIKKKCIYVIHLTYDEKITCKKINCFNHGVCNLSKCSTGYDIFNASNYHKECSKEFNTVTTESE